MGGTVSSVNEQQRVGSATSKGSAAAAAATAAAVAAVGGRAPPRADRREAAGFGNPG